MNRFVGVGLVAAAVVVVALVGYSLLPSRGGTGAPAPSATPTPVAPLPSESLPAGSFTVTNASFTLVPYTFTVPAGWIRDDGGALRGDDSLGELLMASTPTPVTVGGLQGVRLDLELAPRAESRPEGCPVQTCVSVLPRQGSSAPTELDLGLGDRQRGAGSCLPAHLVRWRAGDHRRLARRHNDAFFVA